MLDDSGVAHGSNVPVCSNWRVPATLESAGTVQTSTCDCGPFVPTAFAAGTRAAAAAPGSSDPEDLPITPLLLVAENNACSSRLAVHRTPDQVSSGGEGPPRPGTPTVRSWGIAPRRIVDLDYLLTGDGLDGSAVDIFLATDVDGIVYSVGASHASGTGLTEVERLVTRFPLPDLPGPPAFALMDITVAWPYVASSFHRDDGDCEFQEPACSRVFVHELALDAVTNAFFTVDWWEVPLPIDLQYDKNAVIVDFDHADRTLYLGRFGYLFAYDPVARSLGPLMDFAHDPNGPPGSADPKWGDIQGVPIAFCGPEYQHLPQRSFDVEHGFLAFSDSDDPRLSHLGFSDYHSVWVYSLGDPWAPCVTFGGAANDYAEGSGFEPLLLPREVHLAPDHGMGPAGLATAAVVTMSPEGGMTRFVYDGRMAGASP